MSRLDIKTCKDPVAAKVGMRVQIWRDGEPHPHQSKTGTIAELFVLTDPAPWSNWIATGHSQSSLFHFL